MHGTVQAVPVFGSDGSSRERVSRHLSGVLTERHGSGSGFGSRKTVPAVLVPLSVPTKTIPTFPVSGSGSVPGPSCRSALVPTIQAVRGIVATKIQDALEQDQGQKSAISGRRLHWSRF